MTGVQCHCLSVRKERVYVRRNSKFNVAMGRRKEHKVIHEK